LNGEYMAGVDDIVIAPGVRTPFVKAFSEFKGLTAVDLGVAVVKKMLTGVNPEKVDNLVWGNVLQPVAYPNVSRIIALKAGLRERMPSSSVNMNCASGLKAIEQAFGQITLGKAEVVLAGGCEAMSQGNLELPASFTDKAIKLSKARGVSKVGALAGFRPKDIKPMMPSFKDPICGLTMGETAEILAREFKIRRKDQDKFADQSHNRAVKAAEDGSFRREIVGVKTGGGTVSKDIGPRADSSISRLAKLKPAFDPKGSVTAGNSSPVTDGGAGVWVAKRSAADSLGLKEYVRIVDYHEVGVDPKRMGLGPAYVIGELMSRNKLQVGDIDLFEINEAFAAQVLAVLSGLNDTRFCKNNLSLSKKVGEIPKKKLNRQGGAIALGHPVGATGARLVLTAAMQMLDKKLNRGVVALCVSGGLGAGMLLERI